MKRNVFRPDFLHAVFSALALCGAFFICSAPDLGAALAFAQEVPARVSSGQAAEKTSGVPQADDETMQSEIVRGTGVFVNPAKTDRAAKRQEMVNLNFIGLNVQDVAKAILGDMLGLNYRVDPAAQGTVSVETTSAVRRDQVLEIFEGSLEASKLALIQENSLYTIVPLEDAKRRGTMVDTANAGYGSEVISLRFVNAADLKKILDPMAPGGGIAQSDDARNVLFINGSKSQRDSLRRLIKQFDVNWLEGMSFALFVPQWSDSQSLTSQLKQVLGTEGVPTSGLVRIVPVPQVNGILVISSQPDYVDRIRQLVETLDKGGENGQPQLFVYHVQNGRATDLAAVLSASYGGSGTSGETGISGGANTLANSGGKSQSSSAATTSTASSFGTQNSNAMGATGAAAAGSRSTVSASLQMGGSQDVTVTADETNNALVIRAVPHQYKLILSALKKLDVRPLQVMIQAVIVEVTLSKDLNYGVQWYFQKKQNSYSLTQSSSSYAPVDSYTGFSYLYANGDGITATLNALSDVTKVKVLSSPKLFVLNNRTAVLQVGDQVPITTQTSVSTETSTASVVNSVEYRDTGIILSATPRVNDSGLVLLDISQEASEVSETSSSDIDSPTIQQRRVASSVAIQDGQTIALGGLIKDRSSDGKTGIPYLSEIPLFGSLFGSTEIVHDRTELLVLLTPHVVRNEADASAVLDEIASEIQDIKPLLPKRKTAQGNVQP